MSNIEEILRKTVIEEKTEKNKKEKNKNKTIRLVINNPELRKKDGTYECWVNGNFYKIKENYPTEVPEDVFSHLITHRTKKTQPTGEQGAVDISEGYKIVVEKSFEVIEVE
ncbi:MAG TPA: hypothetical protein PLM71_07240 [Syntrophorhabdaceae bacterium]|nr:hypothetical protein [Syntrophorhabdaceae bacterium]